jgi:ferredoxin-fold anticodon binding domain-containing protein
LNKINRFSVYIALIVFSAISFLFLHSELGLFECEHDTHEAHDFCRIVQNTTDDDDTLHSYDLAKIIIDLSIIPFPIYQSDELIENHISGFTEQSVSTNLSFKVYLKNKTLLI